MPKVKTVNSVARRFKLTKRGKITHRSAFNRHLKRKKTAARSRRLKRATNIKGRLKKKLTSILKR